jgi:N-acetylglucosaminyldiphosphoundecaprenol N-acetyl-beta-D-mannosaminyltransferase
MSLSDEPCTIGGMQTELSIVDCSLEDSAQHLLDSCVTQSMSSYHFVNAYSIASALMDKDYARVLGQSTKNFPDGKPLVLFARLFHFRRIHQIRGLDFLESVLSLDNNMNVGRHLFLGTTDENLAIIRQVIGSRYPNVNVVMTHNPGNVTTGSFNYVELEEIINRTKPNIIWLGLGSPMQDFIASQITRDSRLNTVAVGAAFDFLTERKSAAPRWMISLGLEWLFRLLSEPKRLYKRYLFHSPRFILAYARGMIRYTTLKDKTAL